ncbi:serine hydrolase domain-containing protein [Variovorax sp. GB1P17]|uniref:serine hydrolase domain-containing protein n=1 Tax=Variovorax sp. GB1P17 TaxID=3443740 RepID=UPI003F48872D
MPSRRSFVAAGTGALLGAPVTGFATSSADWQTASPESQGIASEGLQKALDAGGKVPALRSIVVVRNGLLVGERYYAGASANDLRAINSATKSVCSVLVGQALQQGKIGSLSQTVGELLPEQVSKAPDSPALRVTLRQILTGTTGLAYDWRTQYAPLFTAADPVAYAMDLKADGKAPGTWSYNDAAVFLVTPILERAHGMPLADIAKRDLCVPLGIDHVAWQRDKSGNWPAYTGIRLRTRDLAKLAWLMADGGRWNGAQCAPADWVADSTRRHGPAEWRNPPVTDTGYGYLWFTGTLAGRPVAWAWGYGGQFSLLVPSLRLAVATAATNPPPQDVSTQTAAVAQVVAQIVELAAAST